MSSVFEIVDYTTKKSCLIEGDIYRSFSAMTGAITDDLNSSTLTHKVDQANIPDNSDRHSDPVTESHIGSHTGAMLLMDAARQGSRHARKPPRKEAATQGSR